MRVRPVLSVAAVALVASSLAFSDPIVDPEASAHCELLRGADTEDSGDDIEACRTDVWFHDAGTKVDNLDNAQGTFATWDSTPPSTSVTGGAGGGAVSTSVLHQVGGSPFDERESFVAAGRVEGAIDAIAVELYLFPLQDTADGNMAYDLDAALEVDGEILATASGVAQMEVAGNAVRRLQFAFTGLADQIEQFHGFGLVGPLGGGHDVRLIVHGTGIASDAAVWVYDTTETPASMVFNPPADMLAEIG